MASGVTTNPYSLLAISGNIATVRQLQTAGTSESYTVPETGWYAVKASTNSTAGNLAAYMFSNNNTLITTYQISATAWSGITTQMLLLKAGTTIKAQFNGPTNSTGEILKIT